MSMHNRLSKLTSYFSRYTKAVAKRNRQRRRRLFVERMEDRRLLAVIDLAPATVYDTLGAVGDEDRFEFSLTSPSKVYIDGLTGNTAGIEWKIAYQDRVFGSNALGNTSQIMDLIAADYTLDFESTNDAALVPYSFRVLSFASAPVLTPGVAQTGVLSPAAETDVYALSVVAGDRFSFSTTTSTSANPSWRLIDPLNREVFNTSLSLSVPSNTLSMTGTYYLLIEGNLADETAGPVNYGFTANFLGNTPPTPFTGTPLTLNTTVSGNIGVLGEQDRFIFNLASSSQLYFDTIAADANLVWTLEGPSGVVASAQDVAFDLFSSSNPLPRLLPGNYRLTIEGNSGATGAYSFILRNLSTAVPITPGTPVNGTLNPATEADAYRFNVTANSRFYFDAMTTDTQNARWSLYDTFGNPVFDSGLSTDNEPSVFQLAGEYTLLVEGYPSDTGTIPYTFNVVPVTDAAPAAMTVGSVVSANIAVPGERDRYAFSLATDGRLYFDVLSTVDNLVWNLEGPAGVTVSNVDLFSSDWASISNLALNLVAGNYVLTVDGLGETVGAYSFRLQDLAEATAITPGTVVTGALDPASETNAYRFNVTAGSRFYFDTQSVDVQNAGWRLLDPLGRVVFGSGLSTDQEPAPLTLPGEYTLLVVGYILDTGTIPYAFRVVPIVDAAPTAITVGSVISGNIASPGERDRFTFSLASASRLYFDELIRPSDSNLLSWSLEGPSGLVVPRDWLDIAEPALNLVAGNYQLTVDGFLASVGAYSVRLQNLATATAITTGTVVTGTLDPVSETNAHRFNVTAGSRFYFDSQSVDTQNAIWRLLDPLGKVVFSNGLSIDHESAVLTLPGEYTLLVEGYMFDTGTIPYAFRVVPVVDAAPVAITVGSAVSGNIAVPGERDRYSFNLASNSRIYFDLLTLNLTGTVRLVGPGIDFLTSLSDISFDRLVPGAYELTIDGSEESVGTYSFRLLNLASATPLTLGSPVTNTLNPASETDMYSFSAAAGDRFSFDTNTVDPQNALWRLLDPLGRPVFISSLGSDQPSVDLSMTGTYTLLIEGSVADPGTLSYSFTVNFLENTPPAPFTGAPISLNALVSGNIAVLGEQDKYTFTLASDSLLYFDTISADPGLFWTLERLGEVIVLGSSLESDWLNNPEPALSLTAGSYQLTIDGADTATGAYSFRMLNFAAATAITPGTVVTGTLDPVSETNAHRFNATAGSRFYFDSQSTDTQNAAWRLIDPLGRAIFASSMTSDVEPVAFTLTGQYTLLVEGYLFDTGTIPYAFNVVPVVDTTTAMTVGSVVSGNIAVPGEQDRYTFSLASASRLYFDTLSTADNLVWTLVGPAGVSVLGLNLVNDWFSNPDPALNLVAGNYVLTVDGSNDSVGAYSFRLQNLAAATAITPGTLVTGTLDPVNETNAHRFNATAGSRFYFDSQSTGTQNAAWRLLDPLGRVVFADYLSDDQEPAAFTLTGEYTLLVEGYLLDTGTIPYAFRVVPVVDAAPVAMTVGSVVSGNIAVLGERDRYTFSLASPSRLYFDALSTSTNLLWTLEGPAGFAVSGLDLSFDWLNTSNPALNLVAGNYQLTVDGLNDALGAYSFRLQNLAAATAITPGTVVTGILDPVNETNAHRFNVVAGSRFYFDSQSTGTQNAAWRLLDSLGRVVFSDYLTQDQEPAVFTLPGEYTLLVEGYLFDTGTIPYTFRVQPVDTRAADTTISSASVPENQPVGTVVGAFATNDVVAPSVLTYALVPGAGATDNSSFSILGNQLRTAGVFDFETKSSYSIRVRTTDTIGVQHERVFVIGVTNVNETPTNISLSNSSIAENAGANAAIGSLLASDPDSGDTFVFSLPVGLTNNSLFNIAGTSLRANASFDFETLASYTVTVRVTDAGGLTFDKQFPISVTNVNDAPTDIALSANLVAENAAVNAVIGTLTATDQDAGDVVAFSLPSGLGDNSLFNISSGSLRASATFDFELQPSYTITVRATDAAGLTFDKQFTIGVTNLNESPTNILLSNSTIAENSGANAIVGTLSANDPDAGSVFTFSLPTGLSNNNLFNVSGTSLRANASFNFEAVASYNVTVRVADAGGLTFDKLFAISVVNVNEVPVIASLGPAITYIENSARVIVSSTATITDEDGPSFANAILTVTNTNGQSTDSLAIVPNAQVTVSGANVLVNAVTVGSFAGGVGTAPFVVTFNSVATSAQAQAVLRSIGFANLSDSPITVARSISLQVTDGAGGTSVLQSKLANVIAVNDPPSGSDRTISLPQNTAYIFTAADFGFSDTLDSAANTLLSVRISSLPALGSLTVNSIAAAINQVVSVADINAGRLRFTPTAGSIGSPYASFTFQVQDNGGVLNGGVDFDPTPNTISLNVDVVVDNGNAGYVESGTWVLSGVVGFNGTSTRFTGSATATATWNAPGLTPGYYEVSIWRVAVSTSSTNAQVTIAHNGITEPAQTLNLASGPAGFVSMGTYFFSGAPGEFLRLSQGTPAGTIRADAVRFSRVSVANAAPTIAAPSSQTVAGNTTGVFSTANGNVITIADVDAGLSQVQLALSATNGLLTLSSTAGLTFTLGGNGQSSMTIRGTLSSINAALNGLSYQPTLNFGGSASIQLTVDDLGNTGTGGAKTATSTIALTVTSPIFVVDNGTAGYVETGAWSASSLLGFNGTTTRFTNAATATATWNAPSLSPGFYEVSIWRVTVSTSSTNAQVTIAHNGITEPAQTLNLASGPAGFVSMGTYFFSGAPGEFLRLSQGTPAGTIRADAVRFTRVPVANAAPTIAAPASQTVGNTTGVFSTANGNAITIADVDAGLAQVQLALSATNGLLTLASTAGLTFTLGGNGQSSMTIRGTLSSINAALNGLTYQPTLNFTGSASIQLTVDDLGNSGSGGAKTATSTIALTVTSPIFVVDNGTAGYVESGTWVLSGVVGFNGTSTRFTGSATATATWNAPGLTPGYYEVSIWRVAVSTSSTNAQVTIAHNGITEPAQTLNLASGPAGFVSMGTYFFSGAPGEFLRLSQGTPAGTIRADAVRFSRVSVANAAPTIAAPASQTVAGNSAGVFSTANGNAITIADVDAGLAQVQLALSATNGLLTLASTAGLTFTLGGNGQSSMTIRGTLSSINAALNGLSYQPTLNFGGSASIQLTVDDLGNTGTGGAKTATSTIALTVTSPVFVVDNGTAGYVESGTWVLSGVVGFNGTSTRFTGSATATATWNAPSLTPGYYEVSIWRVTVSTSSTNAQVTIAHNGITEPAQTLNLASGPAGFVSMGTYFFSGAPGEFLRLSQGTPAGTLRADAVRFTRVPVANAAPTIVGPASQTVAGNTARVFSTANGNAITVSDADAGLAQVQLALSATNGLLTLSSTAGLTFTAGGNGQSSMTIRGTLSSINAALNGLSYQPTLNFAGSASIQLTVDDLGNTGTGGAKTATSTIALTVNSPIFVVDNGTAGYVETGAWSASSLVGFNGTTTRFTNAATATATWNAPSLAPGNYQVAIWRVASSTNSNNARVTVSHNGGTAPAVTVDLSTGSSGFVEIGTFFFSGAPGEFVRLSQGTVLGNLRADAVRFIKLP